MTTAKECVIHERPAGSYPLFFQNIDKSDVFSKVGDDREISDEAWLLFHFVRATHTGQSPYVEIERLVKPEPVESKGSVLALLQARLLSAWWGEGEIVPPLVPGRYFLTTAMERLITQLPDANISSPGEQLRREHRTRELVFETLDAWRDGALILAAGDGFIDAAERERIVTAHRMIETHFDEKLTIDRLARLCGLGRCRLMRGFRHLYGCTISEHLAAHRLSHAAQHLILTKDSIAEIAYRSGYLSNAAFSRAFTRHFGQNPREYRASRIKGR